MVVIFSLLLVHRECIAFLPCALFTHDGLNSDTERQSKSSSCLPTLPPQGLTSRSLILCSDISKWKVWQLKGNCPLSHHEEIPLAPAFSSSSAFRREQQVPIQRPAH